VQATEGRELTWQIIPEKDANALRKLRAVYLYVLGLNQDNSTQEFARKPSTDDPKPDDPAPIETILKGCKMPRSEQSGCFQVGSSVSCGQPGENLSNQDWVCLGRYGSIYENLALQREVMISRTAYNCAVLFDLVLFSLQVQSDAERDARAKIKAAETAAESKVKLSYAEAEKAAADAADHNAKMENAEDEAVADAKAKRRAAKLAPPNQ
jgi:hypothetical protein